MIKSLEMLRVFVYGTLKPEESNYLLHCEGYVIEKVRAYAEGELYHLKLGYPAMIVGEGKVHGYLLTFWDSTRLKQLDDLEGYNPYRSPQDNEYLRRSLPIYTMTGNSLGEAWTYVMTLAKIQELGGTLIHSGWWTPSP